VRAFTLVEILIVVVVIATIVVAAFPAISSTLDEMKATSLAREIAAAIRYAQTMALKTGDDHRVQFLVGSQEYSVQTNATGPWGKCDHPITKTTWEYTLENHRRYAGIRLTAASFNGGNSVQFDAYGAPQNGGFVTLTLGDVTRTIRVAPLSGKITVE